MAMMNAQEMRQRRREWRWNHWEAAFANLRAVPYFRNYSDSARKFAIGAGQEIRPIIIAAQDMRRNMSRGTFNPKTFSRPPLYSSREVSIHIDRYTKTKSVWYTASQYCFEITGPFFDQWEQETGMQSRGFHFVFIALPDPQIDYETGVDLTVGFIIKEYQLNEVDDECIRRAATRPRIEFTYDPDFLKIDWEEEIEVERRLRKDLQIHSLVNMGIPYHLITGTEPE